MDGPPTKLWKTNPNGSPKLPTGIPSLVPHRIILGHDALRSMERENVISVGLPKYVKF
jgi:hypothetical protein